MVYVVFFFNDTATTEIYTLSLHDALPISTLASGPELLRLLAAQRVNVVTLPPSLLAVLEPGDRKSTRLNSSHVRISYAVFCLKKKTTRPRCPPPPRQYPASHMRGSVRNRR